MKIGGPRHTISLPGRTARPEITLQIMNTWHVKGSNIIMFTGTDISGRTTMIT